MKTGLPARAVVFDLDGTLLDSFGAIGKSLDFTRAELGCEPLAPGAAHAMIGFGLDRLLEQAFAPGERGVARAIYLAHYQRTCVAATSLMPGAAATLEALQARGLKLAVATNKPAGLTEQLLSGLGLGPRFDAVVGAGPGLRLKPHPDSLLRALEQLGVPAGQALYVGDMHVDVETGRAALVRVVAVATGAQSRVELERAGAACVIASLDELVGLVELVAAIAAGPVQSERSSA